MEFIADFFNLFFSSFIYIGGGGGGGGMDGQWHILSPYKKTPLIIFCAPFQIGNLKDIKMQ